MKIYNLVEDIVKAEVESVCKDIKKDLAYEGICTCEQCRLDAMCYVLNRTAPRYFASDRGLVREEIFSFERQQKNTDLITLIFEAFTHVSHNRRPNRSHDNSVNAAVVHSDGQPVFNIPAIAGRILDGRNFAPMSDVEIGLYLSGDLVKMKNENWQNPYPLNIKTAGTFTFWPACLDAQSIGEQKTFEFLLQIDANGFDAFRHYFSVPVTSERDSVEAISMGTTIKLPSLYMFPPEKEA